MCLLCLFWIVHFNTWRFKLTYLIIRQILGMYTYTHIHLRLIDIIRMMCLAGVFIKQFLTLLFYYHHQNWTSDLKRLFIQTFFAKITTYSHNQFSKNKFSFVWNIDHKDLTHTFTIIVILRSVAHKNHARGYYVGLRVDLGPRLYTSHICWVQKVSSRHVWLLKHYMALLKSLF